MSIDRGQGLVLISDGMIRRTIEATARTFRQNCQGVAALEFAIICPLLTALIGNMYDFTVYIYDRMQAADAAQMGAQAAWQKCDPSEQPATVNCPGLTAAVNAAVASTSLGSNVTLVAAPSEGYYCLNASNALQYISSVSSKPANCAATGNSTVQPGDYITVQVTYPYVPIFPFSLAYLLQTPIVMTGMVRLD